MVLLVHVLASDRHWAFHIVFDYMCLTAEVEDAYANLDWLQSPVTKHVFLIICSIIH